MDDCQGDLCRDGAKEQRWTRRQMSGINSPGLLIYQKRQSDLSIIGSRYSISEEKILDHKLDDESMCQR